MKLLKAMAIAFSIYSKIPVPQFEWKEEDMEYMMCFFPWIGGVIGLFFFGWAVLLLLFHQSFHCAEFSYPGYLRKTVGAVQRAFFHLFMTFRTFHRQSSLTDFPDNSETPP